MTNETKPAARRGRPPGSTAEKTRIKRLELERIKSLKKRKKAIKKAIKTPKTPPQFEGAGEPTAKLQISKIALNQTDEACLDTATVTTGYAAAALKAAAYAPATAAAIGRMPVAPNIMGRTLAAPTTGTATGPDTAATGTDLGAVAGAATDASDSTAPIRPPSGPVYPFGHGGARPNSGRRGKEYEASEVAVGFDEARTRNETAKAGLNEIELKIKSGEYIARAAVQTASATALATMAQTMRSIPDNMERKGVEPEVCVMVERVIDEVMAGLSLELEMLGSEYSNAQ